MDEAFTRVRGEPRYRWRAVVRDGDVPHVPVTRLRKESIEAFAVLLVVQS